MRIGLFAAAALAALSACAAAATTPQAPLAPLAAPLASPSIAVGEPNPQAPVPVVARASVSCRIEVTPTRHGVRFEPTAQSATALSGGYRFVTTRTDASGSSENEQGGDFNLRPHARTVLSSVELSMDRGARYTALLILENERGVVCRREVRS